MSKILPWIFIACLTTVLFSISACNPTVLDDSNDFLSKFVGPDFLATLGFIMAITVASAGSLHLELNKIEDKTKSNFQRTRSSINRSVISLVSLFGFSIILLTSKFVSIGNSHAQAIFNSMAIVILFFYISVLLDLTRTVFAIPTISKILDMDGD